MIWVYPYPDSWNLQITSQLLTLDQHLRCRRRQQGSTGLQRALLRRRVQRGFLTVVALLRAEALRFQELGPRGPRKFSTVVFSEI